MKQHMYPLLLILFLAIAPLAARAQPEVLTNADVLILTRARLGSDLIIQKIGVTKTNFDTTTTKLVELKAKGVSNAVISAMIAAQAKPATPPATDTARTESTGTATIITPVPLGNPSGDAPGNKVEIDKPSDKVQTDNKTPINGSTDQLPGKNTPVAPANGGDKTNGKPVTIDPATNEFKEATAVVTKEINDMVAFILDNVRKGESIDEAVANNYVEAFSYTAALAIEKEKDSKEAIFSLAPVSYVYETARTDKQVGASASSTASLSQIDKPGFANILGFAIEHGYVQNSINSDVMTLSTTPGALFRIGADDYQKGYERAGILNNFGLSASFNVTNQNNLLANAARSQLKEFSIRYSLFDHGARSPGFQKIFDEEIAPKIKAQLQAVGEIKVFVDDNDVLRALRNDSEPRLKLALATYVASASFTSLSAEKQKESVTNFVSNFLKSEVYTQLHGTTSTLPEADKATLRAKMTNLLRVQKETIFTEARKRLDAFYKQPNATVAYINHRDPLGNYSEFKFLYEREGAALKPLSLILNGGLSFYHKPNSVLNQQKVRDASFAASLEGKAHNPFLEDLDWTPITYSFTGRYARMYENKGVVNRKADLASFQFLVNVPMYKGFSIPFSATYSNATETDRRRGVRFHFGLKIDTDKIFELARINHLLDK